MNSIEVIIAASIVFAVVVGFAFPAILIETQYPANPAKWRSERRRRVENARARRISILEHDLGYVPCSNDDCYSCKKIVAMPDGGTYQMNSSTDEIVKAVYDKQIKIPTRTVHR